MRYVPPQNSLHFLVFNIKLQGFGRSNDALRPIVVEEIQFSEEVACGGYHTCVVTGISFVLGIRKSKEVCGFLLIAVICSMALTIFSIYSDQYFGRKNLDVFLVE